MMWFLHLFFGTVFLGIVVQFVDHTLAGDGVLSVMFAVLGLMWIETWRVYGLSARRWERGLKRGKWE